MIRDDITEAKQPPSIKDFTSEQRRGRPSPTGGVSVTVNIPALGRASFLALLKRLFLLALVVGAAWLLLKGGQYALAEFGDKGSSGPASSEAATRTEANFTPLIPSDNSTAAGIEPRYDGKRNLVTYTVTFSGVRLTVSQQPLPENFATDKNALLRAAESIKAKQKFDTAKGPVYVASNEDSKDQLAVFAGADVLVFFHAAGTLGEPSWKAFVEQLEAK